MDLREVMRSRSSPKLPPPLASFFRLLRGGSILSIPRILGSRPVRCCVTSNAMAVAQFAVCRQMAVEADNPAGPGADVRVVRQVANNPVDPLSALVVHVEPPADRQDGYLRCSCSLERHRNRLSVSSCYPCVIDDHDVLAFGDGRKDVVVVRPELTALLVCLALSQFTCSKPNFGILRTDEFGQESAEGVR